MVSCFAEEFVQSVFCPQVAVLCSEKAQEICRKNNLTYCDMLNPFTLLNDISFKDASGTSVNIPNFRIKLSDMVCEPVTVNKEKSRLNKSVNVTAEPKCICVKIGNHELTIPESTPWFTKWRTTFLQLQQVSDHEYTKHFLGCMMVISSSDENEVATLTQQVQQSILPNQNQFSPKWFHTTVLRYYVVLHENTNPDLTVPNKIIENLQLNYGHSSCYLLRINSLQEPKVDSTDNTWDYLNTSCHIDDGEDNKNTSREFENNLSSNDDSLTHPLSPQEYSKNINGETKSDSQKIYGGYLDSNDYDSIKELTKHFVLRSLIPYIESQIQSLNESVANKKGVSRSLLSATKRWFSTNKPTAVTTPPSVIYTSDSPELQTRRLADLYMILGAWSLAFPLYQTAKRDFSADNAWMLYSGAVEMAALCALLCPSVCDYRKAIEYANESVLTYLNTCRVPQFATRATLLMCEMLVGREMYSEAAKMFIQMTNEDSDLRSAILLEQAAYSFLKALKPIMLRKYAFHMVLAGHRYSKALQRKQSLSCYQQAYQVFEGAHWTLAEDHIQTAIGRQATFLKYIKQATDAYSKLLARASNQLPEQQSTLLRDYLNIKLEYAAENSNSSVVELALPLIDQRKIKVLLNSDSVITKEYSFDEDLLDTRWHKMEEDLITEARGTPPLIFKPTLSFYGNNSMIKQPVFQNELVQVQMTLSNPLNISLSIEYLSLTWTFDKDSNSVESQVLDELLLAPSSTTQVILGMKINNIGILSITGVQFRLMIPSLLNDDTVKRFINGWQPLDGLSSIKLNVQPPTAMLKVDYLGNHVNTFIGEMNVIRLTLENNGVLPLHKIFVSTSINDSFFSESGLIGRNKKILNLPFKILPGSKKSVDFWFNSPNRELFSVDLLFYYEPQNVTKKQEYRLCRASWKMTAKPCVQFAASALLANQATETLNLKTIIQNVYKGNEFDKVMLKTVFLNSPDWKLSKKLFPQGSIKLLEQQQSCYLFLQASRTKESNIISKLNFEDEHTGQYNICEKFVSITQQLSTETSTSKYDRHKVLPNVSKCIDFVLAVLWQVIIKDHSNYPRIVNGIHRVYITKFNSIVAYPETGILDTSKNIAKPMGKLKIFGPDRNINPYDGTPLPNNMVASLESPMNRLLNVAFSHPNVVNHSFIDKKICIVSVLIILKNCVEHNIEVKIDADTSSLKSDVDSQHFCWVGVVNPKPFLLPVAATHTIQMRAAIVSQGCYKATSKLNVFARPHPSAQHAFLTQIVSSSSLLVIKDAKFEVSS
ncbi:trafficking protein particle complex subunit 8 [Adelges cooleyi]|uniref:trafficking protein particle complex subunit 8 n=1 Tax=Adelges cooleyi TaxID=133065 RepID=UPI002180662E|nr:trafficking protein particle complex subunit 8 [Adelges cooleyi]